MSMWPFLVLVAGAFALSPHPSTRAGQTTSGGKSLTQIPTTTRTIPSVAPSAVTSTGKSVVNQGGSMTGSYTRSLSNAGLEFIKSHEGFRPNAYQDSAGLWTIGFGHLIVPGDGLSHASVVTADRALTLLRHDTETAQTAVRNYVTAPLTQGQFDALVSLVFNIGAGNFRNSTLLRKINARDYVGARAEFARWNLAGGRVVAGLTARRAAEASLFA